MNRDRFRAVTAALLMTMSLAGCAGGLLGGGKPDILYRFGSAPTQAADQPVAVPTRIMGLPEPRFAAEASSDRILTSEGATMSYVKDMRWVSPAPILYAAAIEAALTTRVPDMAVAQGRTARRGDVTLSIEIRRFEAGYDRGAKAPPTVRIEGSADLINARTQQVLGRYRIAVSQAASANTGGAIAAAFDAAVRGDAIAMADWVNAMTPRSGSNIAPAG